MDLEKEIQNAKVDEKAEKKAVFLNMLSNYDLM
jgi:hypothetical protein